MRMLRVAEINLNDQTAKNSNISKENKDLTSHNKSRYNRVAKTNSIIKNKKNENFNNNKKDNDIDSKFTLSIKEEFDNDNESLNASVLSKDSS